jgi:L-asparaginase
MIRILATGGTLDKNYDKLSGELTFGENSHLGELLEQARCTAEVVVETVMLKDSLDMGPQDRELIFQRCRDCAEDRVVITHGTDTMTDTAAFIGDSLPDKTVVLVGAMIPYSFVISDALFNLGFALAAVQTLPRGCYVAMNGRVFDWSNVEKNRQEGVFREKG